MLNGETAERARRGMDLVRADSKPLSSRAAAIGITRSDYVRDVGASSFGLSGGNACVGILTRSASVLDTKTDYLPGEWNLLC